MERFSCGQDFRYFVFNMHVFLNLHMLICMYIQSTNSGFKWSFNRCVRSSQDIGPIGQKLQAKYGSENRCLNTANRFDQRGSILMLYPCNSIHPVNGCFKFKGGRDFINIVARLHCQTQVQVQVSSLLLRSLSGFSLSLLLLTLIRRTDRA